MQVANKTIVSFHYQLHNSAGEELETSRSGEPSRYLHGANNIIAGLEKAMTGRGSGDSFEITLLPHQAYGERNEQRCQRVPMKHLMFRGKLRAGMRVQMNTEQGPRSVTVIKAGRHSADWPAADCRAAGSGRTPTAARSGLLERSRPTAPAGPTALGLPFRRRRSPADATGPAARSGAHPVAATGAAKEAVWLPRCSAGRVENPAPPDDAALGRAIALVGRGQKA